MLAEHMPCVRHCFKVFACIVFSEIDPIIENTLICVCYFIATIEVGMVNVLFLQELGHQEVQELALRAPA